MKKCSTCGQEKALTEFHSRIESRDRRKSSCKACDKTRLADYRARTRLVREKFLKDNRSLHLMEYEKNRLKQKLCRTCKLTKLGHEFRFRPHHTDKLNSYCTQCERDHNLRYRILHWDKIVLKAKLVRQTNPRRWLKNYLNREFNMSLESYDSIILSQNGVCAICKKEESATTRGVKKRLSLDHCHKTGKVRGVLCDNCNRALGLFRDDPNLLRAAIAYLEKHQTTSLSLTVQEKNTATASQQSAR